MREGQAKVLSERELQRVVNMAKKKAHAKRNVALLYCSFGLGLRAKEMAALKIRHVLGVDDNLLEEINLTSAMTKGNKPPRYTQVRRVVAGSRKTRLHSMT